MNLKHIISYATAPEHCVDHFVMNNQPIHVNF